jgi:K+-dependent Na+/Ca+ exchanger related-protein
MYIILFILGISLILLGANWLVDGASGIAKKFGLSEFVIGAVIVGIGTSTPELVTSLIAAIKGNADITIGNITGSNIFNTLMILGVTVLIAPIKFTSFNIRKDIPIAMVASLLFLIMATDTIINKNGINTITRIDGLIMLLCFVAYMYYSFKSGKSSDNESDNLTDNQKDNSNSKTDCNIKLMIFYVIIGLGALIGGGELFVNSATIIAKKLGVSDSVISMTLMAGGTSLPELASCVIAAIKKRGQLALGNVLGSNVSNILLIIGASSMITPLKVSQISYFSIIAALVSSILLFITIYSFKKKELDRWEGVIFLIIYCVYIYMIL